MSPRRWFRSFALLGLLVGMIGGCSADSETFSSPDGVRSVVTDRDTWGPDRIWTVAVRDAGLLGRRHDVGCFTDDDPASGTPTGVTWTGADEFVIATTTPGAEVVIGLNPDGSVANVTPSESGFLVPCPAT